MSGGWWSFLSPAWNPICWLPIADCSSHSNPPWILRCSMLCLSPTICKMNTRLTLMLNHAARHLPRFGHCPGLDNLVQRLFFLRTVFWTSFIAIQGDCGILACWGIFVFILSHIQASSCLLFISFHSTTGNSILLAILWMFTPDSWWWQQQWCGDEV